MDVTSVPLCAEGPHLLKQGNTLHQRHRLQSHSSEVFRQATSLRKSPTHLAEYLSQLFLLLSGQLLTSRTGSCRCCPSPGPSMWRRQSAIRQGICCTRLD